jgi:hypothetical protein
MVPLLQQLTVGYLQKIPALQPADLLFLDIRELTTEINDPAMISKRRDRYMENTDYLSARGVEPSRLITMMRNP